jgi:MFS family permease
VDRVDRVLALRLLLVFRILIVAGLAVPDQAATAIFAFAALNSIATTGSSVAEQATVAALVDRADLPSAIGTNSVAMNIARLASPALGGVLMSGLGFPWTMAVIAVMLGVAAVGMQFVPREVHSGPAGRAPIVWLSGLHLVCRSPTTRTVATVQVLDSVKEGALTALFPVVMLQTIGASEAFMGMVNSSFAVSALIAGPLTAVLMRRAGARSMIVVGTSVTAGLLLLLALAPSEATALISFAGSGFPFTLAWTALTAALLLDLPNGSHGRALGTLGGLTAGAVACSALIAGVVADQVGPLPVLAVAAVIQFAAAAVGGVGLASRRASSGASSLSRSRQIRPTRRRGSRP